MPRLKLDIATLRRLLAEREKKLSQLTQTRERLMAELARVDRRIAQLAAAEADVTATRKPRPSRRPALMRGGRLTLRAAMAQVLRQSNGAMSVKKILEGLSATGYSTTSKNLENMVRQALYKCPEFRRVRRGKYTMNQTANQAAP
mgnify:CR=1 FL=1